MQLMSKSITFTDKCGIGKLKMKGTRDLLFYHPSLIKRVRLVRKADGYYIQFAVDADRKAQYPTVSKNPVWDGEKRSIKASICTSRCFSGWLHARTNSLRPKVMTLHALLPWVLSRTLC